MRRAAEALNQAKRWPEAVALFEKRVAHVRRKLPADHADLADAMASVMSRKVTTAWITLPSGSRM